MTFQTPSHGERFYLTHYVHLIYTTVTRFAAYTHIYMNSVTELGIVGQLVYFNPGDGIAGSPTVPHWQQSE